MYIKELTNIDGVSGFEEKVREFIKEKIQDKVDHIKEDTIGNLIAFKKGQTDKRLMLSAHMDEVGFIVSNIEEDGKLSIIPLGSIDPRTVFGKKVLVGEKQIPGVIGSKPIHLMDSLEKVTSFENIKVDIGATKKQEVELKVKIGDSVSFAPNTMIHQGWISGKALDDRGGCSILMDLIDLNINPYYDTYFSFVVQEETGLRGSGPASFQINPDFAIVIETTTSGDNPEFPEDRRSTELGKGPAITPAHRGYVNDEKLFNFAVKIALENQIPYQIKRRTVGGTDAQRIAITTGTPALVISIPSRYIHSPMSVLNIKDYENTLKLLSILITKEVK
ncbi:MAG TPA: M42 family metallopeptidase [Dictyoglomaceae bacterium]|nr:M42 family metallopeptidase [Dictyoglomaceae bacterium]HOL39069.1 M42 family metallopeptidase [Dictyoglomaceae bacterium]HPP15755.1 M42 family metallopeptidase [Dictyoglomaceae bacterium]